MEINVIIYLLNSKLVYYIVDRGYFLSPPSENYYEKWNSGKLVMWGNITKSIATTTAVGSLFYGIYSLTLPRTSLTRVCGSVSVINSYLMWANINGGNGLDSISVLYQNFNSTTDPNAITSFYVVGTIAIG